MKKKKNHLLVGFMTAIIIVLGVLVFSSLIYQYNRTRDDFIKLAHDEAKVVLDTIVAGIDISSGIRKQLREEELSTNILNIIKKECGTGRFFQKLGNLEIFDYLVCQDEGRILVASGYVPEMSDISFDPFLKQAFDNEEFLSRLLSGKNHKFEAVRPFKIDDKKYLLRVSITLKSIRRLELQTIKKSILLSCVFIFVTFVLIMYFLNLHNSKLIAIERDEITAQVEKMQQESRQNERNYAMGRLAAGVAHEIRNPLNAIQILVQRLERETAPDKEKLPKFNEFTRVIKEEVRRLNGIVEQFLSFSKTCPAVFDECNPELLVHDIVCLEQGEAQQKNIKLKEVFPDKIDPVFADSKQIKQALINVVKNALEATPEGGEIVVSVAQDKSNLTILVEDTGCGMDLKEYERAFDLYFSTKDNGTGLGLAITRRIIEQHGGKITLEPRKNEGTMAKIIIPVTGAKSKSKKLKAAPETQTRKS